MQLLGSRILLKTKFLIPAILFGKTGNLVANSGFMHTRAMMRVKLQIAKMLIVPQLQFTAIYRGRFKGSFMTVSCINDISVYIFLAQFQFA